MVDTSNQCSIVLLESSCKRDHSPAATPIRDVWTAGGHPVTPEILITSPRHAPRPPHDDVKLAEVGENTDVLWRQSGFDLEDEDLEVIDLEQEQDHCVQSLLTLGATSVGLTESESAYEPGSDNIVRSSSRKRQQQQQHSPARPPDGVLGDLLVECELGGGGGGAGSRRAQDGDLFDTLERLAGVWCKWNLCGFFVDPQGNFLFFWTALVSLCFLYNLLCIPLRFAFSDVYDGRGWLVSDYLFADLVYLLDLLLIQPHVNCMYDGTRPSPKVLLKHYVQKRYVFFLADAFSLMPLELLYTIPDLRYTALLRLPRLLKVQTLLQFHYMLRIRSNYPTIYRLVKLVFYFAFVVHLYTCIYYLISRVQGFGATPWVYNGEGIAYIRCYYYALQMVANIHEQEFRPVTTNIEFIAEILGYLIGLFILAVIILEMTFVVEGVNIHRETINAQLASLKLYMQYWKTPRGLRSRVQAWYGYALSQELDLNEAEVTEPLNASLKLKSDLAVCSHVELLQQVPLFKHCERGLLRDLVLKLKVKLYLPGDYICRKNDVGREMYIVNKGELEVLGGPNLDEVLTRLGPGSTFGEISLLSVGVGQRRTASVRSQGYTSVFTLGKRDFEAAVADYPGFVERLKQGAKSVLQQDRERWEEGRRSRTVSGTYRVMNKVRKAAASALKAAQSKAPRIISPKLRRSRAVKPQQLHTTSSTPRPPSGGTLRHRGVLTRARGVGGVGSGAGGAGSRHSVSVEVHADSHMLQPVATTAWTAEQQRAVSADKNESVLKKKKSWKEQKGSDSDQKLIATRKDADRKIFLSSGSSPSIFISKDTSTESTDSAVEVTPITSKATPIRAEATPTTKGMGSPCETTPISERLSYSSLVPAAAVTSPLRGGRGYQQTSHNPTSSTPSSVRPTGEISLPGQASLSGQAGEESLSGQASLPGQANLS